MKAIILAAGVGSRLKKLSKETPKCLLKLGTTNILDIQIQSFLSQGIKDIIVITGYYSEKINSVHINKICNKKYRETNMVYSLMQASQLINDESVIVSYADIIFERSVLKCLIDDSNDNVVVVDKNWKDYWVERYGASNIDIESLKIINGRIIEIGKSCTDNRQIDARYVGLMKFSKNTMIEMIGLWDSRNNLNDNSYMTDMIQVMIDNSIKITAHSINGDWYEIDTEKDYELAEYNYIKNEDKY